LTGTGDISSTEKLLDVIRGKNNASFPAEEKPVLSASEKQKVPKITKPGTTWPKVFSDKKTYTIGVDISHDFIRLSRTAMNADGKPVLLDYKTVGYNNAVNDSSGFNSFLKTSLLSFCGNTANCNIWTLMSAAEVNVHHIKVPRAAKNQLDNIIYWTAKKEYPFEEKDFLFDFELQGEIVDQGIPKYSVMVYSAPIADVEKVRIRFSEIGVPLTGITIAPFAIQNIFRKKWMSANEDTVASLYIGNDFSRIDILSKENLVMIRGIKTGITSMMEAIADTFNESGGGLRLGKEEARKILFSIASDADKLKETDHGFGLTEKEIFEMVQPALERLARQIERTLEHYNSTIGFEKVERIYISSAMNVCEPIINYLSDQLGVKTEVFDPFAGQAAIPAIGSLNMSERMSLVPALGLSLSDNFRTPNVIFTYLQKRRETHIKRFNKAILAAFIVALIICLTTLIYQGLEAQLLNGQIKKLEKTVSSYNPLLSAEKIEKMAMEVAMKKQIGKTYAERYLIVAMIGEISDLTPANIRLINLKIAASPANDKGEKASKDVSDAIIIEGLISGQRATLDSSLTQYMMKLENSPMLRQIIVGKSSIVKFKKTEVLQFTLNAKIG
jgi:Tfp pilus assembly PilM family ATPase/cell division protein FtsL